MLTQVVPIQDIPTNILDTIKEDSRITNLFVSECVTTNGLVSNNTMDTISEYISNRLGITIDINQLDIEPSNFDIYEIYEEQLGYINHSINGRYEHTKGNFFDVYFIYSTYNGNYYGSVFLFVGEYTWF
jgi:hypothetical protein